MTNLIQLIRFSILDNLVKPDLLDYIFYLILYDIQPNDPVTLSNWKILDIPIKLCGKLETIINFKDILPDK